MHQVRGQNAHGFVDALVEHRGDFCQFEAAVIDALAAATTDRLAGHFDAHAVQRRAGDVLDLDLIDQHKAAAIRGQHQFRLDQQTRRDLPFALLEPGHLRGVLIALLQAFLQGHASEQIRHGA
ncbi:hypothetical protein D3C84_828120 [compost metagenome]